MFAKPQPFENTAYKKTKPRIMDAGPYSVSNPFEEGCICCWLPGTDSNPAWRDLGFASTNADHAKGVVNPAYIGGTLPTLR